MSPSTVLLRLRRLVGPPQEAEDTDGQLLERFLTLGDEVAFEMLLERHGPMVHGVCRRLLHDPHHIEDAFQATFLVLVRKAGTITRRDSVGSWLHGVARRVALRVRGRSARQQACEKARAEMIATRTTAEPARDDVSSVLDEEVQRLPPKYRTALVLCYLEGKTNEEAARQLGCPPGTIFTRLSRGREMLRGRLVRRGVMLASAGLTATTLGVETASADVPTALRVATLQEAMQVALGKAIGSTAVAAVVEATVREIASVRWKALGGILLTLATLGGISAALALTGAAPEPGDFPRRLLAIHVGHHLFADAVEPGPKGRDFRVVASSLSRRLRIAERNTTILDESGRSPLPLTRGVLEKTITDYLDSSRAQDRIILLFAGRAAVIRGKAYLVPFEGEPQSPGTLVAFDWLYKRLEGCKARQKVLIVDLCRIDRKRAVRRLGSEPMDDILDRALRSPPDGVEVWSSCVSGQGSYTDEEAVGGSLFLEQLFLTLEGPAGFQVPLGVQGPGDAIPIAKLAAGDSKCPGVDRGTQEQAQRRFKVRQTPRLVGSEKPTFEKFDPREAQAARLVTDWTPSQPGPIRMLHRVAMALDTHQMTTPEEFRGTLDECKQRVKVLQPRLAVAGLELQEALEELEQKENKPADKQWQPAYEYTLARLKARIAHNYEYNYLLSEVRTDNLPELPPEHGAWRLQPQENMQAKGADGKEAMKRAKEAREAIDQLVESQPRMGWKQMAERDHILTTGLRWITAP
jgi:RNA polymerase sigma factor (sigma-70 family)